MREKKQDAVFSVYCIVDKTGKTHFKLEPTIIKVV